jgi:sugar lactone lactonase YvrE
MSEFHIIKQSSRKRFQFCRTYDAHSCISLDSQVIYRYDISGEDGLAVDRQGYIYISELQSNDIQRLSSDGTFRDIVQIYIYIYYC